jgi:hypothetical protein
VAQGDPTTVLGTRRRRSSRQQRLGRHDSVDPAPIENHRDRQIVAERDFGAVASLETKIGTTQQPYWRLRLSWTQAEEIGLGLKRNDWTSLSGSLLARRGQDGSAQSGQQRATVRSKNVICHPVDADHFMPDMSSFRALADRARLGHFFAANRWAHVISPPQRSRL